MAEKVLSRGGKRCFRTMGHLPLLCVTIVCSLYSGMALASMDISYDFSVRERFEIWDGYNKKAYGNESINPKGKQQGEAFDNFILQRVIFGLHSEGDRFAWRFDMYDSRSWGTSLGKNDFIKNPGTDQEHIMDPYEEFFEPYELYVAVKGLGPQDSRFTVGRQIIGYGDNRIFGPGAVTNSIGWLWDAVRYSFRYQEGFIDAWYGQTKTQDPDTCSLLSEYAFQGVGVYGHWPFKGIGTIEPFFSWKEGLYYNNGSRDNLYYFGARAYKTKEPGLIYDITMAWETGTNKTFEGPEVDVDALGYAAKIGWYFKDAPLSPRIMICQIYASGDADPDSGDKTTYTRPFGTTDGGFYGIMDLMSWSNMRDDQIDLHVAPWDGYDLRICYHNFHLDQRADKWAYFGYQVEDNQYDHVGNEIEFVLTTKPFEWLKVMAFYGHFCAGDFVEKNDIAHNNADRIVLQLHFAL